MKIKQAKEISGIKYDLNTREDFFRAERETIKLIVAARRSKDNDRAAELSDAHSVFKKLARAGKNTCVICGATVSRGAIHCRIHARPQNKKISSATEGAKIKGNGNAHIDIPKDHLAPYGYYAAPVRKVISKWSKKFSQEWIELFFNNAARVAFYDYHHFNSLVIPTREHMRAFLEIATAVLNVCEDKTKPDAWLLQRRSVIDGRGGYYKALRENIIKNGGPDFTIGQLTTAKKKLALSLPKSMAKSYREFCHVKNLPKS